QEEPRRVGADRVVARVGSEGLLVGADEGAVRRRVERGAVVHRRDDAERLVTHVPQQRLVHGGLVRQERDRAPEPGVLELLEEAERGDAGEADEDGVDVAAELADVGRLVRRGERALLLLEEQLDAVLHLFAGRRERPGQDRDEADADPLLRRGRRRGEDGERRERESTNDHARLLPSWAASEALG